MQPENYFDSRDKYSIASRQEALLRLLVQRRHFLAYTTQISEYDAFAYLSLLLVARLSVGRNVSFQMAASVLAEDPGWSSVGGYIKRCTSNPSIESAWIDFCTVELPDFSEKLYDVYCHALDMDMAQCSSRLAGLLTCRREGALYL